MHAALDIDSSRKLFVCTCFNLPSHTAKTLTYALLFPVLPPLFLLLCRRATFYKRAQEHDLDCVREAFLFDMCQLYPHASSRTFQLLQMLQSIDVELGNDISRFPRQLEEITETTADVEMVCFQVIRFSEEKTLSFFCAMQDFDSSRSFCSFLTLQQVEVQNFVILFLNSGLRWRFFVNSA
jgi:hypothetical protein